VIEVYSIDEAFLDLTGMHYVDLYELGLSIRKEVLNQVGIPVSIGIAPTKTLAKMANRYAKKEKKTIGVHIAQDSTQIEALLSSTKVEDIWGVGRQYAMKLMEHHVVTAADLVALNEDWIRTHMTVVGLRLVKELKGMSVWNGTLYLLLKNAYKRLGLSGSCCLKKKNWLRRFPVMLQVVRLNFAIKIPVQEHYRFLFIPIRIVSKIRNISDRLPFLWKCLRRTPQKSSTPLFVG